jgi:hypothetical protein
LEKRCKGGLEGLQLSGGKPVCDYLPYAITCLADVLAFLAWVRAACVVVLIYEKGGVAVVSFRFIRSAAPASH